MPTNHDKAVSAAIVVTGMAAVVAVRKALSNRRHLANVEKNIRQMNSTIQMLDDVWNTTMRRTTAVLDKRTCDEIARIEFPNS